MNADTPTRARRTWGSPRCRTSVSTDWRYSTIPRKLIHTSVEYVDVAAVGQEALKETAYLGTLRTVDALAHVIRAFEDPAMPHMDGIDPLRDVRNVEFDLMLSDLGQIEKRLERLEKDLKRMHAPELQKEHELLQHCKAQLETEHPLRELELTSGGRKTPEQLYVFEPKTGAVCAEHR